MKDPPASRSCSRRRRQNLHAFGCGAHHRGHAFDERLIEIVHELAALGVQDLDQLARDVRRTERRGVDQQKLLLNPECEVRGFAEVVLHAVSLWVRRPISSTPMSAKDTLIEELRRHALIVGEVTLTSGATAQYYVDAKRAILQPTGFAALSELIAGFARQWEATAVGGLTMGADAPACAALAGGADVKAFFVRKEAKAHGLQRKVEGPPLEPGERCLIVEDVVTSGGSTVQAIEAVRAEGYDVVGVVSVLDRLAGGAEAIALASGDAPYEALATIDEVYPDRPDRS